MPHRPPNLQSVFVVEKFKRASRTRPLVRLYRVSETALKEVSFSGYGVKRGEKVVCWIDPNDLLSCSEAELLRAVHAVLKRRREVRGAATLPGSEALEVYRLKQQGLTVRQIAKRFEKHWRDCSDLESRERRVKRHLRKVRAYLARANEREAAALSPRQRAILKLLTDVPPVEPMAD